VGRRIHTGSPVGKGDHAMSNGLLESLEAKLPDMDAIMAIPDSGFG
jgi:hypothetical protein